MSLFTVHMFTVDAAISQRASFAHLVSPSTSSTPSTSTADGVAGAGPGAGPGAGFVQLSHSPFAAATELGRAEAIGSLARILCSARTHESVLRRYLARFYICLHYALKSVEVRTWLSSPSPLVPSPSAPGERSVE